MLKSKFNSITAAFKTNVMDKHSIGDVPSMGIVKSTIKSTEFEETLVLGGIGTGLVAGATHLLFSDPVATSFSASVCLLMVTIGSYFVGRKEDSGYWLYKNKEVINTDEIEIINPVTDVKSDNDNTDNIKDVTEHKQKERTLKEIGDSLTSTLAEYKYSTGGGVIGTAVVGFSDEAPMVIIYNIIPVIEGYEGIDVEQFVREGGELNKIIKKGADLSVLGNLGDNLSRDLGLEKGQKITVDLNVGGGRGAIYLPKEKRDWVYTKDYLRQVENSNLELPLFMGVGLETNPVIIDLVDAPHCIIGGTTKSGKTISVLSIVVGLANSRSPDFVNLTLIDPKRVGLKSLSNLPHLKQPVITDMEVAMLALRKLVDEMEERYELMERIWVQDIKEYNAKSDVKLPYSVIVFDELSMGIKSKLPLYDEEGNETKRTIGQEIESLLVILTAKGRAAGMHCIFLTQRFAASIFDGELRDNVDMGVCMRVGTSHASKMIIGESGGENLLGYGDSLVTISGWNSPVRVQGGGFQNGSDEVKELVEGIKEKWKKGESDIVSGETKENDSGFTFVVLED